jgi:hypothetical protein
MTETFRTRSARRDLRVTVRQAVRLGQRGVSPGPAIVVAVSAVFVIAMFVALSATNMSPAQERDKTLGRFTSAAGYGSASFGPGDDALVRDLTSSMQTAGARATMVSLTTTTLYVGGLSGESRQSARVEEHPWSPNYLPRYHLASGRWPSTPDEVALSGTTSVALGAVLPVSGSAVKLTVVGLVNDDYSNQPAILAAPGTWRTLDPKLAQRFTLLRGQMAVFWAGGNDRAILKRIEAVIVQHRGKNSARIVHSGVQGSYFPRSSFAVARSSPWVGNVPIGYTVPALFLPFLAAGFAFSMAQRRVRRLSRVSAALGLPPRVLVGGFGLTLIASLVLAAVVGGILGWGVAHLARPLLVSLAGRPVDLQVGVARPILRFTAITALAGFIALGLVLRWGSRRSSISSAPEQAVAAPVEGGRTRPFWRLRITETRWLLALATVCYSAFRWPEIDSPAAAMAFSGYVLVAFLLVLPDLVAVAVRFLPESRWVPRLVRRRLQASPGSSVAVVGVVAVVVGMAFGYLALLETLVESSNSHHSARVAPGQVLVVNRDTDVITPPKETLDFVARTLPASAPYVDICSALEVSKDEQFVRGADIPNTSGRLLVAPDSAAVATMLGRKLTGAEASVLDRSGMIVWTGGLISGHAGDTTSLPLEIKNSKYKVVGSTPPLPVVLTTVQPSQWQDRTVGMMIRRTADQLNLPVYRGARLYTQVPDSAVATLKRKVSAEGFDPDTVQTFKPPARIIPAAGLPAVALGLSFLMFAMATAATWSGARALRQFASLLVYLGISPARAKGVVMLQNTYLFLIALVFGGLLAVPPVLVLVVALPGYTFSIPWAEIGGLTGAVVLACFASVSLALIRFRAALDRGDD